MNKQTPGLAFEKKKKSRVIILDRLILIIDLDDKLNKLVLDHHNLFPQYKSYPKDLGLESTISAAFRGGKNIALFTVSQC